MSDTNNSQIGIAETQDAQAPYSVWLALAAGLFVSFSWILPNCYTVAAGVLLIMAVLFMLNKAHAWHWVMALVVIAMLVLLILPNYIKCKCKSKEGEVRQNLHAIQLALERYAADYTIYPASIESLRTEGYMPRMPRNPYSNSNNHSVLTGMTDYDKLNRMQPLGADYLPVELRSSLSLTGDFCYIPRLVPTGNGKFQATEYLLICMGKRRWYPDWYSPPADMPIVVQQLSSW